MTPRRFYLPSGSAAAAVVQRKCVAAGAYSEVERYPFGASDRGDSAYVRLAVTRPPPRYRSKSPGKVSLETDVLGPDGVPVYSFDVPLRVSPARVAGLLTALSTEYEVDRCAVYWGHWGDARLRLEDRSDDGRAREKTRLVVVVSAPDGWVAPGEWVGAVEVSADVRWSRPLLTRATWPAVFAPVEDASSDAGWG